MKVKSESEVTQSFPTLSDSMDLSLPGSSAHGIFQARVLDGGGGALPSPSLPRFSLVIHGRVYMDFPGGASGKNLSANAGDLRNEDSIH